jgi:hypothetical protein
MPAGKASCISEGMLGGLENVDVDKDGTTDHYRFSIRNQFLHPNHPLGWIRQFGVAVDGQAVPSNSIQFVVRNQWIAAEKLPTIADIWWSMREIAEIYVPSIGLEPGSHRVEVSFDISLFAQTSSLDRENKRATLRQTVTDTLEVAS